ncbi:MAG: hypothetical protein IKS31_02925 [Clostridia bacterium]|nr:hypothetical protein [Clostridia bacterium]
MRKAWIVILTLALLLPVLAAAAESTPPEIAREAALAFFPEECVTLENMDGYAYGQVVCIKAKENGKDYVVYYAFQAEDVLQCVFYGTPETCSVTAADTSAAIIFLNGLNAETRYPALYLTGMGYPAGFAAVSLPEGGDEVLRLFVRDTLTGILEAMPRITAREEFGGPVKTEEKEETEEERIGYHPEYVYEDRTCPYCYGTGLCKLCHGTGTYRMYGQSVPCDRQCSYCGGNKTVSVLVVRWVPDEK